VPTSDPNEPSPGAVSPFVDSQYFLVANVLNTSSSDVLNAEVYFWWADPSLGILATANAHAVGKSSVSVVGNGSNTSLEPSPWTPSFVNNGHECLIAAVVETPRPSSAGRGILSGWARELPSTWAQGATSGALIPPPISHSAGDGFSRTRSRLSESFTP
jgi:hypothetical protein